MAGCLRVEDAGKGTPGGYWGDRHGLHFDLVLGDMDTYFCPNSLDHAHP